MGFLVSLVFTRVVGGAEANGLASCNFPAVYNFGDSNSDTGVCLITVGPTQPPTGRLCDERLIIDFIAEELGIPYLSPYLCTVESNYSHGANFAHSGTTIRPHLAIQTALFSQLKARAVDSYNQGKNTSGLPRPEDFSEALYTLDISQSDCYQAMWGAPPPVIPDKINNFNAAIQSLYDEGGRAFWVHNVGPNGCLPFFQSKINRTQETFDKNGCIDSMNEIVMEFNKQLKDRVMKLRAELQEAFITYFDVYTAKYNLISNAKSLGFTEPLKQCINGTTCEKPSMYISLGWGPLH